jgi:C4-dicarboxylate-specific signal transduction histidine kinase
MKLPVTFEQFSKDPVKAVTFCMLVVVIYLWNDNRVNYQRQIDNHQAKIESLEKKVDKCLLQLKRSDSALAAATTKLEVLSALGKIPQ